MLSHLVVDLMFICICPIRIYSNLKLHTFVDMSLVERGRSRPSLSEGVARRSAKRSIFRATLSVATRSIKGSNRWSFIVAILRCFLFRDKLNAWHILKCMGLCVSLWCFEGARKQRKGSTGLAVSNATSDFHAGLARCEASSVRIVCQTLFTDNRLQKEEISQARLTLCLEARYSCVEM